MFGKTTPAQRFAQIFRVFINKGATQAERDTARRKMDQWLKRHGKVDSDIPSILAQAAHDDAAAQPPPPPSDPRDVAPEGPIITPLGMMQACLETYLALEPYEFIAVALWAIHTHVFDRFMVTPRLVLTSPVRNCGKTTALDVLSRLVARPEKTDNITAAAIYDIIDRTRCTLLVDEADNLELGAKAVLRAVLNSGYRYGGTIRRGTGKQARKYSVFAPIALASIGALTLPLLSRSVIIHMRRHDGSRPLQRFDFADTRMLDIAYTQTRAWAHDVVLNPDPELPLHGRDADNWRALIAIADACGEKWGALAREAAVAFIKDRRDEDAVVILLKDVREVFDAHRVDRLRSRDLVAALNDMEDAGWTEWHGRKLTAGALARLLRPLNIRSRSIWPTGARRPGNSSAKGYYRADFESAWRSYCDEGGTTAQPRAIKQLRSA
jgi:hypothetical protein